MMMTRTLWIECTMIPIHAFAGELGDYRVLDSVRVPTTATVHSELEDGPFVYFRGRITSFAAA